YVGEWARVWAPPWWGHNRWSVDEEFYDSLTQGQAFLVRKDNFLSPYTHDEPPRSSSPFKTLQCLSNNPSSFHSNISLSTMALHWGRVVFIFGYYPR
ncbi:hypothetical protein HAX54_003920, partial [Datura stramonium]|nr:hypothetical protein [Datura stramonium]